jgi:histidyl-tRNA synthetase
VFFEEAKLTKQYMTAEKKGIRWVLMVKDGIERYTVRDLETRENKEGLTFSEVIALVAH